MNTVFPQFIKTLHDGKEIGRIGNGTHYSVLRTTTWFDNCGLLLKEPMVHDFAIIWDRNHDNRVIEFVEHMYMNNLLSPVLFVGESNGHLCVLVTPQFKEMSRDQVFHNFTSSIIDLAKNLYEPWSAEVGVFGEALSGSHIINSSHDQVDIYLNNIFMLWELGLKNFRVGLCKPDLTVKSEIGICGVI